MLPRLYKVIPLSRHKEQKFCREYINIGLFQVKALYILGVLLYGIFSILDIWLLPESRNSAWIIRFGVVIPVFLVAFLLAFNKIYQEFHEIIAMFTFFLAGLGIILMMNFAKPSEPGFQLYYTGLVLLLIATYTGIRVRLRYSLILGILINLFYPLNAVFIQRLLEKDNPGMAIVINNTFFLTGAHVLAIFAGYYMEYAFRADFISRHQLKKENRRADKLLKAILPDSIVERINSGERTIADEYENVSILFADIVGFTNLSNRVAPLALVKMLNQLFSIFDDIAEKYGIEKIKTIGDNYMIASGLPNHRSDHAQLLADFAIDIRNQTRKIKLKSGEHLQIRIGIHSGKAAGGVIGKNKFIFDVWGDTVNTASRMESHGIPGEIQISESTFNLLNDNYNCEARGELEIKGKGIMKVYILKNKNNFSKIQINPA